jgi:hypothetical protein
MYGLQNRVYLLYNISSLVFITETVCVYCAIRTGSLNTIQDNIPIEILKKAPSTSVISPLLTTNPVNTILNAGLASLNEQRNTPTYPECTHMFIFKMHSAQFVHLITTY